MHDELVLEVPDGELDRVQRELPELMTGVAQLAVPLVVDVGVRRQLGRGALAPSRGANRPRDHSGAPKIST